MAIPMAWLGASAAARSGVRLPSAIKRFKLPVVCAGLLVLTGAVRIVSTYNVFSETVDEPVHVACGMQWLQTGRYQYELQHPPLARVAAALGPYLAGVRTHNDPVMLSEGRAALYANNAHDRNLFLSRLGILPFFLVAGWTVWLWTRRLFGNRAAIQATLLFTSLPPVLAHSGLSTTDMALAAFVPATLYAFTLWLESPAPRQTALLGVTLGLAVLSKFSSLLFLPVAGLAILAVRAVERKPSPLPRRRAPLLGVLALAFLVIWAGYRFTIVPLNSEPRVTKNLHFAENAGGPGPIWVNRLLAVPLPAAQALVGFANILHHNSTGHPSYLLGQSSSEGWWYFFPIVLGVKTPLAFLVLCILGTILLLRPGGGAVGWRIRAPAVCAASMLLLCTCSRINLGVRHILPIYVPMAILAGYGASRLFALATNRGPSWRRAMWIPVVALLLWHSISSARAHPDYLAYFNEAAGAQPEHILADSDLDWGQDLKRLAAQCRRLGVRKLAIMCQGSADLTRLGLPESTPLYPYRPATGWVAVSYHTLKVIGPYIAHYRRRSDSGYVWLERYRPFAVVGKSILLYYVPTDAPAHTADP